MPLFVIMALTFVELHSPDGKQIAINPSEISSVREPRQGQLHPDVKCVIVMTNRSFLSVIESCDVVQLKLKGGEPRQGPCTLVCGEAPRRELK